MTKETQFGEPFRYLWEYTEKTGYDFYVAKDEIEERIGRKIICECQVLNDERAIRRKKLEIAFGLDFGTPDRRDFDIVWIWAGVRELLLDISIKIFWVWLKLGGSEMSVLYEKPDVLRAICRLQIYFEYLNV